MKRPDLSFRFDGWWNRLPSSPRDVGRVRSCVLRTGPGERETPEAIEVEAGKGAVGDAWATHRHSLPENEVSLINCHVIDSLSADGVSGALSGDNLQVDLDLSEENLPVGTRLAIGEALLVVSPMPHRPCRHFAERFGPTAAKKIARANRLGKRGRGVLCTVEKGGTIRSGDEIHVRR